MNEIRLMVDAETGVPLAAQGPSGLDGSGWKQQTVWVNESSSWRDTGEIKRTASGLPLWKRKMVLFDSAARPVVAILEAASIDVPEAFA
jgi:hypothetical protein